MANLDSLFKTAMDAAKGNTITASAVQADAPKTEKKSVWSLTSAGRHKFAMQNPDHMATKSMTEFRLGRDKTHKQMSKLHDRQAAFHERRAQRLMGTHPTKKAINLDDDQRQRLIKMHQNLIATHLRLAKQHAFAHNAKYDENMRHDSAWGRAVNAIKTVLHKAVAAPPKSKAPRVKKTGTGKVGRPRKAGGTTTVKRTKK